MPEKFFNAKCIGFIKVVLKAICYASINSDLHQTLSQWKIDKQSPRRLLKCRHDVQIICDFYLWWLGLLVYSEFSMA